MRVSNFLNAAIALVTMLTSGWAFVSASQAAPVLVDFTDAAKWSSAQGQGSFTASYGDLDVTASTSWGKLTFNANDKAGCVSGANQDIHDLECDGDGLGINNDEITQSSVTKNGIGQAITIMFSKAVSLHDIELLDLFNNSSEHEVALIRLNNGIFNTHVSSNLTGGYHRTFETGPNITMVVLKAADDNHSDYALARMSLTIASIRNFEESVPTPPAFLLMVPGIAMLIRRRLKREKTLPVSRWLWTRPSYMGWA